MARRAPSARRPRVADLSAIPIPPRIRRALALASVLALATSVSAQTGPLRLPPVDGAGDPSADEVLAPSERLPGSRSSIDESDSGRAFVEVATARRTAFVGELLVIEVRFGFETAFLESELIPLFRRHLDVPIQVEAAWLDDAQSLEPTHAFVAVDGIDLATIARNDRVARVRRLPDRVEDGRTYRAFALDVRRIERAPGTSRLAGPRALFARASAFTEDFVHGRVASERVDAFVACHDLEIEVAPLPESGRPASFSGAVGDFRVEARVLPAEIADSAGLGITVRVELVVEGDGDLGDARMPDASSFPGWRVLGVLDDRGRARRTLTFDLERAGDVREIPAVAFAYFDPRPPGTYRTAESLPIELLRIASPSPAANGAIAPPADGPPSLVSRVAVLAAAVALAIGAVLAAFVVVRRRARGASKEQEAAPRPRNRPLGG